jgi:hypothetical protein
MIVLGANTHTRSHTIAAVSAATGELIGEQTVQVGAKGFAALVVGVLARLRVGVGAGGLPARLELVRAVSDRTRRAGSARDDEADGGRAAGRARAREVRRHRRDRSRPRRRCARAWTPYPRRTWTARARSAAARRSSRAGRPPARRAQQHAAPRDQLERGARLGRRESRRQRTGMSVAATFHPESLMRGWRWVARVATVISRDWPGRTVR